MDKSKETANNQISEIFYHGTKANLKEGDLIESGFNSNYGQQKKARFVYLTATIDAAIVNTRQAAFSPKDRLRRLNCFLTIPPVFIFLTLLYAQVKAKIPLRYVIKCKDNE